MSAKNVGEDGDDGEDSDAATVGMIDSTTAAGAEVKDRQESQNQNSSSGSRPRQTSCVFCPRTKKMKCLLGLAIFIAVGAVTAACLFRNPTLFMYPLHASCNVTWTFQDKCGSVSDRLIQQMDTWKTNETCGTGQKCLYDFGKFEDNTLTGIHTTPKARYIDDLEFKFYPNTATGGCNVVGFSNSRIFFAILDFGTNYCNLHNLMEGSKLTEDAHFSELTRDEICTQYTSANCEKY